jgi:Glycosyl hydrolases family 25
VTQFLIDVASPYQDGIDLAKVKAAGFTLINVKLSQGVSYINPNAQMWIDKARSLGMGVCTFHWLDNSASGRAQANFALGLMDRYGVRYGAGHQCDCEDTNKPATWAIWRDYMNAMQDGMGHHVAAYTGDWWWEPRGWDGASITPYLWAAPNDGYVSSYPGDSSSKWNAGYGGWSALSAMQYAVSPISGAGGGDVSKTAFRDPAVWTALTGVDATSGENMDETQRTSGNADQYGWGLVARHKDIQVLDGNGNPVTIHNLLDDLVQGIDEKVTALSVGGVDLDALAAKIAALIPPAPTVGQIADELARRLQG